MKKSRAGKNDLCGDQQDTEEQVGAYAEARAEESASVSVDVSIVMNHSHHECHKAKNWPLVS